MVGDSIFDNRRYVGSDPDVRAQVKAMLPEFAVSSSAKDGALIADVGRQLGQLPQSVTHLAVSIGGNDALRVAHILDAPARSVSEALDTLASIRSDFGERYSAMADTLLSYGKPLALCNIYEPRFADLAKRKAAATALTLLNDVISREAFRRGASLIDLRLVCASDDDFANAIEPSAPGGAKIAGAISRFVRRSGVTSAVYA
jgi:hypothetical protein